MVAYFRESAKHVSAETLYSDLKQRGHQLSLSTVYLNLRVLRDAEIVREFQGIGGEALYDSNVSKHYHLICRVCECVSDLPAAVSVGETPEQFKSRAEAASGWELEEPNLSLYGLCPRCARKLKEARKAQLR